MRYQVSHPYKAAGIIIVLYILMSFNHHHHLSRIRPFGLFRFRIYVLKRIYWTVDRTP
jgi:hypothetical protein